MSRLTDLFQQADRLLTATLKNPAACASAHRKLQTVMSSPTSDEEKIRFEMIAKSPQIPNEFGCETIGRIEPQPVDIKLRNPPIDRPQKMFLDIWIEQIEFDQFMVPFPV